MFKRSSLLALLIFSLLSFSLAFAFEYSYEDYDGYEYDPYDTGSDSSSDSSSSSGSDGQGYSTTTSGTSVVGANEGLLQHTIFGPLGTIVEQRAAQYYAGETEPPGTKTTIISRYSEFGFNYDSSTFGYTPEPYCRVGGTYTIEVISDVNPGGRIQATSNLFSCVSTKQLISELRMPTSWAGDDLVLYCNDGGLINFETLNFDLYTSDLNVYKACILKNLDLPEQNTIVYGYESGNLELDPAPTTLIGPTTTNQLTADLSYSRLVQNGSTQIHEYTDSEGKLYTFTYEFPTSYFILTDVQDSLSTSALSEFAISGDFRLSRMALFRSFGDNRDVYGYETAASWLMNTESKMPVYKVNFQNVPFFQRDCVDTLASYGSIAKDTIAVADSVTCPSTNNILINSDFTDQTYGDQTSYNIMKNIILDLEK